MSRVPVTIVTGALGAGKTTLVNHLIRTSGQRLAVIVNEFGAIGIDGELIESGNEELIELNSGCICCVVRGDLIRTLRGLSETREFDGVVIETTGLANPGPVIQTLMADQQIAARYRLDAVVTLVDAVHIDMQLTANQDIADQIALANIIIVTKGDLALENDGIERRLRALNPFATILRADRGRAPSDQLLGINAFDIDRIGGLDRIDANPPHDHDGPQAICLTLDEPVEAQALYEWLEGLLSVNGASILRTKGIFDVAGEDRQLVVHAVHMLMEGDFTRDWPAGPRESRVVFIGRNLDKLNLKTGLASCVATVTA